MNSLRIVMASLIFLMIAGSASAKCGEHGVRWVLGGAIGGATVGLMWGGALIAAPFTAGGSLGVAEASTGVTFAAISSAVAISAGTAVTIAKGVAMAGAAVGAAVEAGDCLVKDKDE